jgi:hypothetical protein
MENFWGNSSDSGKLLTLQKIMAGAQLRVEIYLKNSETLPVPCQCTLLSVIKIIFKEIHLYTILIQGISTIFIDQMPTYLCFQKSTSLCWHQNYQQLTT